MFLRFFISLFFGLWAEKIIFFQANASDLSEKPLPIFLKADTINYDEKTDTIIATGNVQIAQKDRFLYAKEVKYNRKKDILIAMGNVVFKEKVTGVSKSSLSQTEEFFNHQDLVIHSLGQSNGFISNPLNIPQLTKQLTTNINIEDKKSISQYNFSFANYAEFSHEFQDGFIQEVKMLMSDNARLAANSSKQVNGQKVIFRQAVYSPCKVCKQKLPLWQIKADKVIHSKPDQTIMYHHARLEIKGVPVFYMPYFRHPDPTIKRKTGFLMPTYGSTSDLGLIFSAPFYYAIAPNRDLTLIPIMTSKQGPVIAGEYRHRFQDGHFSGSGSYTQGRDLKKIPKGSGLPKRNRWHIFTQGRFDLNDEHVATFDINKASDTTYLRRYPILPQGFRLKVPMKNMVSTAALEQFRDHSYAAIRTTTYQTDNPATTPYVLPQGLYSYQSIPQKSNALWNFDANFLSLGRKLDQPGQNARHMQRLSLNGGWRLPYITSNGHIWAYQIMLRGDTYILEHYQPSIEKSIKRSAFRSRLFPTASAQWRYPLVKRFKHTNWVLEPTAMLVGTPRVNNSSIPNEDSLNIQIEDTSLFLPHRFSGLDRVDTGGRFIYGTNSTWFFPQQRFVQFFLGQSIRLDNHQVLPYGAGENKKASDIITRFRLQPTEGLQFINRMSWHYKKFRPRIADTSTIIGKKLLMVQLNHTFVHKNSTISGLGLSQVTCVVGSQPFEHWSFSVGQTRNLRRHQRGLLSNTLSALYHDECFRMTMTAFKARSIDRDIQPNSGFIFQLDFKNLGSINPLNTMGINANSIL